MERRWSRTGAPSSHAHTPDHDRHRTRRIRARRDTGPRSPRPGGRSEQPGTPQPPSTPQPSRRSAPGRSSSTTHTRWAHDPTRSRSQTTSEPQPPDASTASPPSPSQPNSKTINSRWISTHNADSRRSTRQPGSASTTPSTPPSTPAQRATLPTRLEKLVHAPDTLRASRSAPRTRPARPRLHRRRHLSRAVWEAKLEVPST